MPFMCSVADLLRGGRQIVAGMDDGQRRDTLRGRLLDEEPDPNSGRSSRMQLIGVPASRSSDLGSAECQRAGTQSGMAASRKRASSILNL